jgi:hypothetical protein
MPGAWVATGCRLEDGGVGVQVPVGASFFSSPRRPDRLWGPPSLLKWLPESLSLGVKQPGHEADRSPTRAEVKNTWVYTSTPPYAFMT